jgi:hypothetical protein
LMSTVILGSNGWSSLTPSIDSKLVPGIKHNVAENFLFWLT